MKRVERAVIILSIVSAVLLFSYVVTMGAMGDKVPPETLRPLALKFLTWTFNPTWDLTVASPEAVTAVIWDFRGLDTFYETAVLYFAIISALAVYRGLKLKYGSVDLEKRGMSPIAKTVTRVTTPMILAVGASIALHGHLTPGGGFQGGSTGAVILLLLLVVFSQAFFTAKGVTKELLLVVRSLGLLGLGLTGISVFVAAMILGYPGYLFQNLPKPYAPLGFTHEISGALISGTLFFLNIFEFFAVAAGLTITFLLFLTREEVIREILRVREGE